MKQATKLQLIIAAAIAGTTLSGCGTITNAHVRHMDNKTLALRHYQLARKNTGRFAWGTGNFQRPNGNSVELVTNRPKCYG